jgi:tetratricopeptide (TPR) repeat protein
MTQMPANSPPQNQERDKDSEDIREGWVLKAAGKLDDAEAKFRKAISANPESVEAYYGLALTLKLQGRRQDSIKSFERVIELVEGDFPDHVRGSMLRRLSMGHINQLSSGDWNLEKEIWQREE